VFFGDGEDAAGSASADAAASAGPKAQPGEEVADPYFGGVGPARRACTECGECMTGCRHGAKNTLTENYLYLAERAGAVIHPMTTVVAITEDTGSTGSTGYGGGYRVTTVPTDRRRKGPRRELRAGQVVLAAGTYGTQTLLHAMRDTGRLPGLSPKLGELTRTNSEALVGAQTSPRRYRRRHPGRVPDFTRGVAITSSVHPNDHTHIEPVRYGRGSNAMGSLSVLAAPYKGRLPRWAEFLANNARHPVLTLRSLSNYRWSERTIIGLVMQTSDNSLTTYRKTKGLGKGLLTARQGHGEPNPTHIPEGARAAELLAEEINGIAGSNVGEATERPMTAHFLGGCPIGEDADHGVIDPYHRLYGHPGISVVDGSAVSANLGVNPSLTITAQAERAMALWPNKGEPDPRPAQGAGYRRTAPVPPAAPAVPEDAFGALRLPLLPVPAVPPRKPGGGGENGAAGESAEAGKPVGAGRLEEPEVPEAP
jgi:cholesterol oxidase